MVIAIVLILIAAGVLGGAYYAYHTAFLMPEQKTEEVYKLPKSLQNVKGKEAMKALIQEMAQIDFEPVWVTSHDGLKLFGRYIFFGSLFGIKLILIEPKHPIIGIKLFVVNNIYSYVAQKRKQYQSNDCQKDPQPKHRYRLPFL